MVIKIHFPLFLIATLLCAGLIFVAPPPAGGSTGCAGYAKPLNRAKSFWSEAGRDQVQGCLARFGAAPSGVAHNLTPLHLAALFSVNPAVIAVLLKGGADPNAETRKGFTPLHLAAQEKTSNPAVVAALLKGGADPNAKTRKGATPLHLAANRTGNPAVVAALLKGGADANANNRVGFTPLHAAAENSNLAVMARLLSGGADPNAKNRQGATPLHLAANRTGNPAVVAALLKGGADSNTKTREGATPLHAAAQKNTNPAVITALLKGGADPNAKGKNGGTPLHVAALHNKNPAVIEALLKGGADPAAKVRGMTPSDLAGKNRHLTGSAAYRQLKQANDSSKAARQAAIAAGAESGLTRADYRAIQRLLNEKGFQAGPADGQWGPRSRSALRTFQARAELPRTGVPDKSTLKALGFRKAAQNKDESKKRKYSADGATISTGATSTKMNFREVKSGKTEIANVACTIEATLKCTGTVNGRNRTCESSDLSQSEIKKMGIAAALMLPIAGAGFVAACFGK